MISSLIKAREPDRTGHNLELKKGRRDDDMTNRDDDIKEWRGKTRAEPDRNWTPKLEGIGTEIGANLEENRWL